MNYTKKRLEAFAHRFLPLLFLAALTAGIASCGEDDPIAPINPNGGGSSNPSGGNDNPNGGSVEEQNVDGTCWPKEYGGVMLQAFYWDSYDDTQWSLLESQADQLAGTFDLVWLPQSGNCGGQSMGYDDLYWFTNYNSSFGTEAQLRSLIAAYKARGIKTIADVVINHRRNKSNWVDFPSETYNGVTYEMGSTDICADDDGGDAKKWATTNGYSLSKNNDTGEGWGGMRDLDHKSENVQKCVKAYLGFLKNDLGYAGFRYDMVKGYSPSFTGMYNVSAAPEFSVGECWDSSNTIKNWILGTRTNGLLQSAAFDFQFKYVVRNATDYGQWGRLENQNEGNWPLISKNFENGNYRRWAVTFVENHDTQVRKDGTSNGPLKKDTLAANAYMMAMPGTPCVFLPHWIDYQPQIKAMVAARKTAGINNESSYESKDVNNNYYSAIAKTGNEERLMVVVGNVKSFEASSTIIAGKWVKVLEGYHYAYYLPNTMEAAYADLPAGTYEGQQQVRLSAVSATEGAKIVFTTDGTQPTAESTAVESGFMLMLPSGKTTTLKLALLKNGSVGEVKTMEYVVNFNENDLPIEIPSFCTVAEGETCAFFEAPNKWGNVNCWCWDNKYNYTTNRWPGVSCTLLGNAPNGHKVWKWTSKESERVSQTSSNAGIIFNDGSSQTADLQFVNAGYYTKDGLFGIVGE